MLGAVLAGFERRSGVEVRVPYQPWATRYKLALGWYETPTAQAFRALIRPGMTIVDGGAHIGYYTLLASRLVGPTGHVIAFEPSAPALAVLRRNIARARSSDVDVIAAALGDASGEATLVEHTASGWSSLYDLTAAGLAIVSRSAVQVMTLDEALAERGHVRIDVVKLDLEGSEPAALRGMRATMRANPRMTLVVELNATTLRAAGSGPRALLDQLEEHGFEVSGIAGRRRIPADDLRARDWRPREQVDLICLPRDTAARHP